MLEDVLPTPSLNARIERPHRLRDGRPVRIRHIDLDGYGSSILDTFGVIQMGAVAERESRTASSFAAGRFRQVASSSALLKPPPKT